MAGETFQLRFRNNEDVYLSIDEPINFATVDFQLSQRDKGYGRDVSFNGGEVQFEFVKYRNHYLDKLISYNKIYGFESIVDLIITSGTITTTVGELDFATSTTDDLEYFKCKVIQKASRQIVKRRKSIKVDLFSSKDIDGNTITPLVTQNLILTGKPIYLTSKLQQDEVTNEQGVHSYGSGRTDYKLWSRTLVDSSILDTYSPTNDGSSNGIQVLKANTLLQNIKVRINKFTCTYALYNSSGGGNANGYFAIKYGTDFASATEYKLSDSIFSLYFGGDSKTYASSFSYDINSLAAGSYIWIYHSLYINHSGGGYSAIDVDQTKMTIDISAESVVSDSVVFSFRLVDVMKQVIKSISGLNIVAPRFDVGGEFYDNRLVNGNFLRKINTIKDKDNILINKAFLISLDDLEKSLVELNADWEIDKNGDIFFGIEDDFYKDTQIAQFTNTQFSSFAKSFNPRFQINEFNYGYKKFQSLKENEVLNTSDVIHGESRWVLANKMVENKKEISIEWTRDAFSIESNRIKAIEQTSNTSSQEDDSLFIIDSKDTIATYIYGSSIFNHYYNGGTEYLELGGTLNFTLLPFNVGDFFKITSTLNYGTYTVRGISASKLEIERQSDLITSPSTYTVYEYNSTSFSGNATYKFTNTGTDKSLRITHFVPTPLSYVGDIVKITTGIELGNYEVVGINPTAYYLDLKRTSDNSIITGVGTNYTYQLNPSVNPYSSYTDAGFTNIDRLVASNKYANLRYSIRRNIEKYWKKYIATCNLYHSSKNVVNSWYKENKYFTGTYDGLTLVENQDINTSTTSPLLTPFMYDNVIFSNVEFIDFINIQNSLRYDRGYILTKDNNGNPLKLYPTQMKYENLMKELTIKGEEKFT